MAIHRIQSVEDALTSYHLTAHQLAAAVPVQQGPDFYYLVSSASRPGVQYKVVYNPTLKALQCLPYGDGPVCAASQMGYNCWHKRAAKAAHILEMLSRRVARELEVAAAMAERTPQEIAEQAEIERLVAQGHPRDEATRVIMAKPYKPSVKAVKRDQQRYQSREFRLLK